MGKLRRVVTGHNQQGKSVVLKVRMLLDEGEVDLGDIHAIMFRDYG